MDGKRDTLKASTQKGQNNAKKWGKARKTSFSHDGVLNIEDGCPIWGKAGHKQTRHAPINLKLVLSIDDLHRLFSYASNRESNFIDQFSLMLVDAIRRTRKGARGKYKGKETTLFWIKTEAACLYIFFSYWCKKQVNYWPKCLQKLLDTANRDGYEDYLKTTKRKYSARELTSYCLEKYYMENLENYGLRPFDDPNNFYITYIQPSLKLGRELMKKVNYDDIESVVGTPVETVFKSLKII